VAWSYSLSFRGFLAVGYRLRRKVGRLDGRSNATFLPMLGSDDSLGGGGESADVCRREMVERAGDALLPKPGHRPSARVARLAG